MVKLTMSLRKRISKEATRLYLTDMPVLEVCHTLTEMYGVNVNMNEIRWVISYDTPLRNERAMMASERIKELAFQGVKYTQMGETLIEEFGFTIDPKLIGRIVRGDKT